jgi:hypothetical protein
MDHMSLQVDDLNKAIDQWVNEQGYRLDSIFRADNPEIAVLSKD